MAWSKTDYARAKEVAFAPGADPTVQVGMVLGLYNGLMNTENTNPAETAQLKAWLDKIWSQK
jgi:hypothetical protein